MQIKLIVKAMIIFWAIAFALMFCKSALAKDNWFCEREAGVKIGNTYQICGVSERENDEGMARGDALKKALQDFYQICGLSADCAGHPLSVEPGRTSCEEEKFGVYHYWKCYRLVKITVLPKS